MMYNASPDGPPGDTSLSLIRRVQQNDPKAWERLFLLYGPIVLGWCRHKFGLDESSARDVRQNVLIAVHLRIGDFRRDRVGDSFRSWLRTITLNKVRDHVRRQGKAERGRGGDEHLRALQDLAAPEDSDEDVRREAAEIYGRALEFVRAEFKETTWRAFWRTAIDKQSAPDVAEELGMKPAAVRKARARVRARLRSELEGLISLDDEDPQPG